MILNGNEKLITDKEKIVVLLKKKFEILFNKEGQGCIKEGMMYHTAEPDIGKPKHYEVAWIIETLKNNKLPIKYFNKIPTEQIKKGVKDLINTLNRVISGV